MIGFNIGKPDNKIEDEIHNHYILVSDTPYSLARVFEYLNNSNYDIVFCRTLLNVLSGNKLDKNAYNFYILVPEEDLVVSDGLKDILFIKSGKVQIIFTILCPFNSIELSHTDVYIYGGLVSQKLYNRFMDTVKEGDKVLIDKINYQFGYIII